MWTITRRILAALFILALLVASPLSFAYLSCEATITVHASGGQTCSRTCHIYDDETHQETGWMTMEYQC